MLPPPARAAIYHLPTFGQELGRITIAPRADSCCSAAVPSDGQLQQGPAAVERRRGKKPACRQDEKDNSGAGHTCKTCFQQQPPLQKIVKLIRILKVRLLRTAAAGLVRTKDCRTALCSALRLKSEATPRHQRAAIRTVMSSNVPDNANAHCPGETLWATCRKQQAVFGPS